MDAKKSLEVTQGTTMVEPAAAVFDPHSDSDKASNASFDVNKPFPTEEEFATLPRVPGSIPWTAWTVAAVEFAERFSYYGTTAVCKSEIPYYYRENTKLISVVNFIQKDLPKGSKTGAGFLIKPGSGALGMGQRASTGLTTCELILHYSVNKTNHIQSTISGLMLRRYLVHTLQISTWGAISQFNTLSASHLLDMSF
jgi:proton-dependent oligopeptide transporter, POT family